MNSSPNDLETLYVALGTQAHYCLFEWWQQIDLKLLYGKVNFGTLCFYMGKYLTLLHSERPKLKAFLSAIGLNSGFLRNYLSSRCNIWYTCI